MIFKAETTNVLTVTKLTWAIPLCTPTWRTSTQRDLMGSQLWVSTQVEAEVDQRRTPICTLWIWHRTLQDPKVRLSSTQPLSYFTQLRTKLADQRRSRRDSNKFTPKFTLESYSSKKTCLTHWRKTMSLRIVSLKKKASKTTPRPIIRTTLTMSRERKSGVANQNLFMKTRPRVKYKCLRNWKKTINRH